MKRTLIAAALSALSIAAHAQDVYVVTPEAAAELAQAVQQREAAAARTLAERRQRMIDECVANHGYEDGLTRPQVHRQLRPPDNHP